MILRLKMDINRSPGCCVNTVFQPPENKLPKEVVVISGSRGAT